jgi:hypothetical protein
VLLADKVDFADAIPAVAGSTALTEIVFSTCATAIVLAVAWVSWQVLESQVLKLKDRVPYARAVEAPEGGPLS